MTPAHTNEITRLLRLRAAETLRLWTPVWGTPARLVKSRGFVKGAWALVFLERAHDKDTEGIHDLTPDGLPLAKVYVRTTLSNRDLVSVSASHELVETLVDRST